MASYLNILNAGNRLNDPIQRFVSEHNEFILDALSLVSESVLPYDAMPLFNGWVSNESDPTSYNSNPQFWLPEVRNLLMTMPAWASNNYHQQGGGIAITPKHCFFTNHGGSAGWGLKPNYFLRWANINTQQTFQTKILAVSPSISNDSNILVLENELPSWVPKASILDISRGEASNLVYTDMMGLCISQGRVDATHPSYSYALSRTDKNMMLYIKCTGTPRYKDRPVPTNSLIPSMASSLAPYRAEQYYHAITTGDSGMPSFFYVSNKLCVWQLNISDPVFDVSLTTSINSAIVALDQQVGVNTGYQIDVVPLPYR